MGTIFFIYKVFIALVLNVSANSMQTKEARRKSIDDMILRGKGKPKSKSNPKDTGSWFDGGRKAMIQLAGELFWKMGEDLDSIAKDYTTSLDAFITQLPMQQHVDLKFLLFRLDFIEYYGHVSSNK